MSVSEQESLLLSTKGKPLIKKLGVFAKLSGPGWMQSAITLGGGSLAGSLFLGTISGYSGLWVQLLAMILGIIMLATISFVTLSIEKSPFNLMRQKVSSVLAWGWILASLVANMVWVLPQYSLAFAAFSQNIFPSVADTSTNRWTFTLIVFVCVTLMTFIYGGEKGRGIVIYESILKALVGLIVVSFVAVVITLLIQGKLPVGEIILSFIPNIKQIFQPTEAYQVMISQVPSGALQEFWQDEVLRIQRERMIAATSAAVGINMTFLLPASLLAKKWNRNFRSFATFDLFTGMLVPFILVTSCIIIASASLFYAQPANGLLVKSSDGSVYVNESSEKYKDFKKTIEKRTTFSSSIPITGIEKEIAAAITPRNTKDFAATLSILMGEKTANIIFGIGIFAMAFSSISMLMLISGMVVTDIFGFERNSIQAKLGTLLSSTGILWPILWTGSSKAYLAVVTSTIGYVFLPIAYLSFLIMFNSKKILGDQLLPSSKRNKYNILIAASFIITALASGWTAWNKSIADVPVGKIFLIVFIVLIILEQIYRKFMQQKS